MEFKASEEQVKQNKNSVCNPVAVWPHAVDYFIAGIGCCFHEANTEYSNSTLMWQGLNGVWQNRAINFTDQALYSAQHVYQYSNGMKSVTDSLVC